MSSTPAAASPPPCPRPARSLRPAAVQSGSGSRRVLHAQGFQPLGMRRSGLPRGESWLRGAMGGWEEVGGYAIGRGGRAPLSPGPSRRCLRDGDPGDSAPSPSVPRSPPRGDRTRLLAVGTYGDWAIPHRRSRLASPSHDSAFFLSIQRSYGAPREYATLRLTHRPAKFFIIAPYVRKCAALRKCRNVLAAARRTRRYARSRSWPPSTSPESGVDEGGARLGAGQERARTPEAGGNVPQCSS